MLRTLILVSLAYILLHKQARSSRDLYNGFRAWPSNLVLTFSRTASKSCFDLVGAKGNVALWSQEFTEISGAKWPEPHGSLPEPQDATSELLEA